MDGGDLATITRLAVPRQIQLRSNDGSRQESDIDIGSHSFLRD
jgi:hypothetical protein